jgi:ATP-dependent DNA ligase
MAFARGGLADVREPQAPAGSAVKTVLPMEARSVDEPPVGPEWQYEPKWDGFRCIAARDGDRLTLSSKAGQPLARYFPELVECLLALPARRFMLDGEIVVPVGGRFSFDDLLQRIHPAASRIKRLSVERPALLIVFDLLRDERGRSLLEEPLEERRPVLEAFARFFVGAGCVRLSPATRDLARAQRWFDASGGNLDGIIAKRTDMAYRAGERDGMVKIKHRRTADCVVGGYRMASSGKAIGSLLLGLYDREGLLHHVGFTSSFSAAERKKLAPMVGPLKASSSFTGRAPGGPSRWSTERSSEWQPVRPRLVVEVEYDHFTGDRFRHGTKVLRWRPDKPARMCTFEQIERGSASTMALLDAGKRGARRGKARA